MEGHIRVHSSAFLCFILYTVFHKILYYIVAIYFCMVYMWRFMGLDCFFVFILCGCVQFFFLICLLSGSLSPFWMLLFISPQLVCLCACTQCKVWFLHVRDFTGGYLLHLPIFVSACRFVWGLGCMCSSMLVWVGFTFII